MKRICFFLALQFILIFHVFSQKTTELGLFLGRSYYIGEMNPKTHLGNGVGSVAIGGVFRLNLNQRYALKASLIKGKLKGNDETVDFQFNKARNAHFQSSLTEFSTQIEFNFLPYETGDSKFIFSPYLFIGASVYRYAPETTLNDIEVTAPESESATKVAMPFGPGLKLSIGNRLSLAFEWGFRKTSNDAIDGLPNRLLDIYELGKNYDNDWYVVSGFMLTYKLNRISSCPAYNF